MAYKYLRTICKWMGQARKMDCQQQDLLAQCSLADPGSAPVRGVQGQQFYTEFWRHSRQYVKKISCQTSAKHFSDLFRPLFEVTQDPTSHPELHIFLQRVVGFDSVDDESKPERRIYKKYPHPRLWDTKQSPPYAYWWGEKLKRRYAILMYQRIYYMFANMASLNNWRRLRGFSTFLGPVPFMIVAN